MSAELLQEYLVKLGFTVDQISNKKFTDSLTATEKNVLKVGAAVTGIVASVEAATIAFAYSMRKMYFDSQIGGTSVKNLNAISYAAGQVGMSVSDMTDLIKNAGNTLWTGDLASTGKRSLLKQLGLSDEDMKDTTVAVTKFVQKMKGNPLGPQYAQSIFGWDLTTFRLLSNGIDDIIKKQQEYKEMAATMGVDVDAANKQLINYANTVDRLAERFELLGKRILLELNGPFHSFADWLDDVMKKTAALMKPEEKQIIGSPLWSKEHNRLKGYMYGQGFDRYRIPEHIGSEHLKTGPRYFNLRETLGQVTMPITRNGWSAPQKDSGATFNIYDDQGNPVQGDKLRAMLGNIPYAKERNEALGRFDNVPLGTTSGGGTNITTNTIIMNVNGVGDPSMVANKVVAKLDGSSATVRNLQSRTH